MTDRPGAWLDTAQPQLLALAGGFLRNTQRIPGVTCPMCTGMPGEGWNECRDCRGMMLRDDLSDRLAFVTYGIKGRQSGHTMHGYKSPQAGPTQRQIVQLLAGVTLHRHGSCFTSPTHGHPTHWTTVPSLSGRADDHPLEQVMAPILANLFQHPITPAIDVHYPRAVRPENFTTPAMAGEHFLLIDDTWTTGGHVQSAAGALKRAGAGYVTTLVLARWIDPAWDNTTAVIRDHLNADFDPAICPFTGTICGS